MRDLSDCSLRLVGSTSVANRCSTSLTSVKTALDLRLPLERLLRSFKTEWLPSTGYMTAREAQRDISYYLMHRYNWIRLRQFNQGLAPTVAEEKLNVVYGMG